MPETAPDRSGGRFALVTGAGSGIGRSVALALLADGWSVALSGRTEATLVETAQQAPEAADRILVHATDVAEPASVDALYTALRARFGRLDLLFNNAGVSLAASPDELSFRGLVAGGVDQPDRVLPVRAGRLPADARADAAGRPDHQ